VPDLYKGKLGLDAEEAHHVRGAGGQGAAGGMKEGRGEAGGCAMRPCLRQLPYGIALQTLGSGAGHAPPLHGLS
jgi:hypothetical protein